MSRLRWILDIASFLKKRQEAQKRLAEKDMDNRLSLEFDAKILGEAAVKQILRHYEFSKATPEEQKQILTRERERLWSEDPFTAALSSVAEIINNRILEGGNIKTGDILDNKNFVLSADFVDSTDKKVREVWTLYVDYNWENPDKKRIAIRTQSLKESKRLGCTFYPSNVTRNIFAGCDEGIGLVEGNNFRIYNNITIFKRWDRKPSTSPINKVREQKYIDTMRLYFDKCLNSPDEVELLKWESSQLKEWMKEKK